MSTIHDLKPEAVWRNFYALTTIPRPSGHTEQVCRYLVDFGRKIGIESFQDEAGNVIYRKPATPGYEDLKGVILQAHMDMVPQKNADVAHDFLRDPIQTQVRDEWLTAQGTTLGADDGLGVAAIMAIMESSDLRHGPLEALITRDEETGMFGAFDLKPGILKGEILLNLDSETEGELYIGCAGGVNIVSTLAYKPEPSDGTMIAMSLKLKGLRGGHSGIEIAEGRANGCKMLGRVVHDLLVEFDCRLASFQAGNMRNAIPREGEAILLFSASEDLEELKRYICEYQAQLQREYHPIESGIELLLEPAPMPSTVLPEEIQDNMINVIMAIQDGAMRVIPTVPDTVETSSNLAIVLLGGGKAEMTILARSSSDAMKDYLTDCLRATFNMAGMRTELGGSYSGWQPDVDSPILKVMRENYRMQFGRDCQVKVIHAGLECGIIGATYPGLDMVSFGPTLQSPHTPQERAHIPSVARFYDFLVSTLERTPRK